MSNDMWLEIYITVYWLVEITSFANRWKVIIGYYTHVLDTRANYRDFVKNSRTIMKCSFASA